MNDREICFTGVEIAGEVDIRFDVLKGKQATWPVTELRDRWVPHATASDYADALQLVSEEAAKLLVDEHGFTIEDAFIFLSVACDAGVAQACKPADGFGTIARFSIPRSTPAPGLSRRSRSDSLPVLRDLRDVAGRPPRKSPLPRGRGPNQGATRARVRPARRTLGSVRSATHDVHRSPRGADAAGRHAIQHTRM